MKSFRQNIILHIELVILFGLLFPLFIAAIGFIFPSQSNGLAVKINGKLIGYKNIGQKFTDPKYFHGRPSSVEYNAAASGASNKGPANPEYLAEVQERIVDFMKENPEVKKQDIPSELVTASGSGLDPHISLKAALIQVQRITKERNIDKQKLVRLIQNNTEHASLGLLGPDNLVNVLKLNIALDNIK